MQEQTLSGYIRQHLGELETRMEYGTPQAAIVKELNDLGYSTTLPIFRTLLARARTWRKKKQTTPRTTQPSPTQTSTSEIFAMPVQKITIHEKKSSPKLSGFEWQGTMSEDDLI